MTPKKFSRNKQEKIELIYDTFFNLILKNGYHKTSTNHVAESAKISIGTIYKYFPNGKEDIIRKYFEDSMDSVLDQDHLLSVDNTNIKDFLTGFISKFYQFHKENQGYNLAFRAAIQSDKALLKAHKRKLHIFFSNITQELIGRNHTLQKIPKAEMIKIFIFIYNLINGIIYHHLSIMNLFDTDDKLKEYLINMVIFSLRYYSQSLGIKV